MGPRKILLCIFTFLFCLPGFAQDFIHTKPRHKFWDTPNKLLFSSHAALESVDFGITHRNLSNGGQELDPMAAPFCQRGTAGQAAFFGGRVAAVVGVSYLLHRTGHHGLERMFPVYLSGDTAYGVAYSFSHQGDAKRSK